MLKAKNRFKSLELTPYHGSAKITRLDLSRFACSGTLPEIQPGVVPELACGPDVCNMASFVRESVANDDSDDNDHITLSLGCLDTESDTALDLDNLSDVTPKRQKKSNYSRSPRWPPRRSSRESTRRSSRESTRRSTRASVTRPPTPPRARDHSRRTRRNRSPSYSPPGRARSPGPDKRVGDILKLQHESYRVSKFKTKEGTYKSNISFSSSLAPNRFRENLMPSQIDFISRKQLVEIANIGTPQSHQINLYN